MDKQELITGLLSLQQRHNRLLREHSFNHWMKLGLTMMQLKSLFFIVETDNASSKKLAEILEVTLANVTGIIDRLTEQDLVVRAINPEDRRVVFLQPTEKGRRLIAALEEDASEHMGKILSSMSREDLQHLYTGFAAFLAVIEQLAHEEKQNSADNPASLNGKKASL